MGIVRTTVGSILPERWCKSKSLRVSRFTNKNPADVFNFLLDGKQGEGQGDLRFLYKSINETLVNTFSYHASSADFEVHRETHLSALPEWIEIPAELVDLAAII